MQTFLPYSDFKKSAQSLDVKRLLNQRNEAMTLYKSLRTKEGWYRHPAAKMWEGSEYSLLMYAMEICMECTRRGYKDTVLSKVFQAMNEIGKNVVNILNPWWVGKEEFHLAHQSNLIRKMPEFYKDKFPGIPNDLPYIWPVRTAKGKVIYTLQ